MNDFQSLFIKNMHFKSNIDKIDISKTNTPFKMSSCMYPYKMDI